MKTMRVGYIGAGNISGQMAETIARMGEVENYAVAARDPERAREFARRWGFSRAYGSYEELLADPDVDLVYVALPHSHHHRWTIAALEAGHHVLCEKAFAANERQAREMVECARERGLLLAEAIWTRYMPSRKMIDKIVSSGEIGVFVYDGSAYLKRLVIDGKKVFLRSLNPKYADIPAVLEDSLRVLGRAL